MKKLLALVLALVMTMSLAVSANAFTDDKDIDANYDESITVLAGMKVFVGDDKGNFNPKKDINRAEAAALIYRLATADVADAQAGFYASYSNFTDLTYYDWAEGYIGYCQNAGLIKGYGDGKFGPGDGVTGYQVLAMILRAVGYGQNGEFTGADWATNVAKLAQQLGILDTVKTVDLSKPASREVVAELLFQAINTVAMVTYTPAFGYQSVSLTANGNGLLKNNMTLGKKNFGLTCEDVTLDNWGRPSYKWTNGANKTYAVIDIEPLVTYTTAQKECNIASDLDLDGNKEYSFVTYANGVKSDNTNVNPVDTKNTVGGQGKLVEFYSYTMDKQAVDSVVMINTYLAKVLNVVDAKYDKAGHQKSDATITLYVYTGDTAVDEANGTTIILNGGDVNYTYKKGDMLLVNLNERTQNYSNSEILGLATSVEGYQSVIWNKAAKHTVNDTVYDDACQFNFDQAQKNTGKYCWYFDQYGNLIGAVLVKNVYDYAVLKNIVWVNDRLNDGYAIGTLVYMDGSENEVTIARIDGADTAYSYNDTYFGKVAGEEKDLFYVTTNTTTNVKNDSEHWISGHLLSVDTDSDGNVCLYMAGTEENGKHTGLVNKVAILNKGTKIGGDAGITVDNGTQFLVLTSAGFATYTGIKNIPNMTDCTVDYVLGADGVAQYVYVIGKDASVNAANFVLIVDEGYTEKVANGIHTFNIYAEDQDITISTKTEKVINTLKNDSSVNKLFYISYTDGLAVDIEEVKVDQMVLENGVRAKLLANNEDWDAISYAEGVLTWNGFTWAVDEDTVTVIGVALEDDMSFEDTQVYVIYTYENGQRTATTLYIIDLVG